jgi:hypothetical protein
LGVYWQAGQRSIYTTTTLKIPQSLTRQSISSSQTHPSHPPTSQSRPPDSTGNIALPASDMSDAGSGVIVQERESYREIKCCFSVTIRRDAWGVPVAIMGQWIVSLLIRLMWVELIYSQYNTLSILNDIQRQERERDENGEWECKSEESRCSSL